MSRHERPGARSGRVASEMRPESDDAVVTVADLALSYGGSSPALDGLGFSLPARSSPLLVGPDGGAEMVREESSARPEQECIVVARCARTGPETCRDNALASLRAAAAE